MSSHHFVKEGQEPALVILDWNAKLEAHAIQLMAWQPRIIVHDNTLEKFIMSGFKPDGVIGDLLEEFNFLEPLEKFNSMDVYSQFNGATFLINDSLEALTSIIKEHDLVLYTDKYKIYNYQNTLYEKWMPDGKKVFYFDSILRELTNNGSKYIQEFKDFSNVIVEEV